MVMDHLSDGSRAKSDNLCIRFSSALKLADVEALIASKMHEPITAAPSEDAIGNLNFGECLPVSLADEVFAARFNDPKQLRPFVGSRYKS